MSKHRRKLIFACIPLLLSVLILCSCSSISYYGQSVRGHLSLMSAREPIAAMIESENTPADRRQLLRELVKIRAYASSSLGLPDNKSYTSFVELDREYVVWNVVAAPEFSIKPKTWCFPIAGCVSYKGYYAKNAAENDARKILANQATLDVAVVGASAYSTLGWFDDPVLSSMLNRGKILLAETLFHELAHQVLYVKNDSAFNEAFATTVAIYGVRQWLSETDPGQLTAYESYLERRLQFNQLIDRTSIALNEVYLSASSRPEKSRNKHDIFDQLQSEYQQLKQTWQGYSGYDNWFDQDLNNAHLAMISTYWKKVPKMAEWLDSCGGDFTRFYASMKRKTKENQGDSNGWLEGAISC